jgi:hypothetical protein
MINPKAIEQNRRVTIEKRVIVDGEWKTLSDTRGEAKFCFFSTDHEEYENGPGHFPVAVVEWPDGRLESFHVDFIRFVSAGETTTTTTTNR